MSYEKSDWQVGSSSEKYPTITRARSTLPDKNYRIKHQHLIIIKWPYAGSDAGMPDKATQKSMDFFENKLEVQLENKKTGVLTVITTGNSVKEWRYYTFDSQKFMADLNEISDPSAPYPIDLQLFSDPNWEALNEIIAHSNSN